MTPSPKFAHLALQDPPTGANGDKLWRCREILPQIGPER
jgi:hypothetical protein